MTRDPLHRRRSCTSFVARLGLCALTLAMLAACGGSSSDDNGGGGAGGGGTGGGGSGGGTSTFTVSATAGSGGSITPPNAAVSQGGTAQFTVAVLPGYQLDNVTGCSGSLSGSTYTTGAITANCTITASFSIALAAPADIGASADDGEVTVSWSPVSAATGYRIYWSETPGIHPHTAASYSAMEEGVSSPQQVTQLVNGTTYYFVVTATLNAVESDASQEVSATPMAVAPYDPPGGLNDTGIDWCADSDNPHAQAGLPAEKQSGCDGLAVTHPRQDAMLGRDALARAGLLPKVGGGAAGFDFTKISNSGAVLGAGAALGQEASGWACTRDNVTGLIWEVKVDDDTHLRHRMWGYTWYDSVNNYGGNPGSDSPLPSCLDTGRCDTEKYVADVNAVGLCGASDWRMPTVDELQSIAHLGETGVILQWAFDQDYFPNAFQNSYWSAQAYASSPNNSAWHVDFGNGSVSTSLRNTAWFVRLVRTAP